MDRKKVLNLAKLARIEMKEAEAEKLSKEFDAILGYVGEVQKMAGGGKDFSPESIVLRNVMREDAEPHESGIYTESVLSQAPAREGNFLKVKKIL